MTFDDFWMLDGFFAQHPPVDLLVAAYLGYKAPVKGAKSLREAGRVNSEALNSPMMSLAIPKGRTKSLAQMPDWVRSPEKMALIEKMKASMRGETDG
jgi:hypothetical protein